MSSYSPSNTQTVVTRLIYIAFLAGATVALTSCGGATDTADEGLDCPTEIRNIRNNAREALTLIDAHFSVDMSDDSYIEEQETYSAMSAHMKTLDLDMFETLETCELHNPEDAVSAAEYLYIALETWMKLEEHCNEFMPILAPQFDCT